MKHTNFVLIGLHSSVPHGDFDVVKCNEIKKYDARK